MDKQLGIMDLAAAVLCMENKMPMTIFGLNEENSIINTVRVIQWYSYYCVSRVLVQFGRMNSTEFCSENRRKKNGCKSKSI